MLFFSLGRQNSFIQHNYEVTGQKIKQNIYVAEFDFCVFYSLGSTCNSLLSSIMYGDSTVFPRIIPGDDYFFFFRTNRGRLFEGVDDYCLLEVVPYIFCFIIPSNKKIISSNKLSMGL